MLSLAWGQAGLEEGRDIMVATQWEADQVKPRAAHRVKRFGTKFPSEDWVVCVYWASPVARAVCEFRGA